MEDPIRRRLGMGRLYAHALITMMLLLAGTSRSSRAQTLQSLSVGTPVVGGTNAQLTVTLTGAAPPAGVEVTFTSDTPAAIPGGTATVTDGHTVQTFDIPTLAVAMDTSVTLTGHTGAGNDQHDSNAVTVTAAPPVPIVASLTVTPDVVAGGVTATGKVTLNDVAPAGGITVTLDSSDPVAAPVPATVMVDAGETNASFDIVTTAVAADVEALISGHTTNAETQQATLTVAAPRAVADLMIAPASVVGPAPAGGTVTISGIAPAGGTVVALSSDHADMATVPPFVIVAPGSATATFDIATLAVTGAATVHISAQTGASAPQMASLTVTPTAPAPVLMGISVATPVVGGNDSTGTVTLNENAPADTVVTLSSQNAAATVPGTVTVPAGQMSAPFSVTTSTVTDNVTVTITAALGSVNQTAMVTVIPAPISPVLTGITLTPTSVLGGQPAAVMLTLSSAAPAGGINVLLSSDNTAVTIPASVVIQSGQSSATIPITTTAVTATTAATLTATLGGASQTAVLTVTPAAPPVTLSAVSVTPASIASGETATGMVTLSGGAPAGGTVVTLASDLAAVTVPASVMVPEGATTASFTVNSTGVSSTATATITATLGATTQSASLTITPPAGAPTITALTVMPGSFTGGGTATGTLALSGPAPAGGLTIQLMSFDAAVQVPATIAVPAGAASVTFTLTSSAVATSSTVSIQASLNGISVPATLILLPAGQPPQVAALHVTPLGTMGGNTLTGTVTLQQGAPAEGVVVTLTSDNAAVQVPTSVTVAPGSLGATFTVTTRPVAANTTVSLTASVNATSVTSPVVVLAPATMSGDLNGDGTVNIRDATLALQIVVGNVSPTDLQRALADANGDGRVAIGDVILILRRAIGLS